MPLRSQRLSAAGSRAETLREAALRCRSVICSSKISRRSESKVLMRADQTRGGCDQIRVVTRLLTIWQ